MSKPISDLTSFRLGSGLGFLGPRCLLLVEGGDGFDIDHTLQAVCSEEPLDAVIGLLTREGLRRTPSFVCVTSADTGVIVLVRGQGRVTAQRADGTALTVDGEPVTTWVESRISDAVAISAWLTPSAADSSNDTWRIHQGAVPASAFLGWRPVPIAATPEVTATPDITATPHISATPDVAADLPPAVHVPPAPWLPDPPVVVAPPAPAVAPAHVDTYVPDPAPAPFASLDDQTLHVTPDAPVLRPDADAFVSESTLVPPLPPSEFAPAYEVDPNITLMPNEDGSFISASPTAPTEGGAVFDPNVTLTSTQLKELLGVSRAAPTVAVPSTAPLVQAVRCGQGHPNPPDASLCRNCATRIVDRSITTIERPSLGRLHFDTGRVVELTQPLLVGRNPPSDQIINGETALPVVIPDPEQALSRLHLEVRIDGWRVLVVDKHSVNATFVTSPGKPATQLPSGEPFPITTGTTVSMGDIASFVYEVDRR